MAQLTPPAVVGDSWADISTPALIVDLDALEYNLGVMKGWAERHQVAVRAHAKAHKCAQIALKQVEYGSVGVCCQKLSEVEAMIAGGVRDVYLSNEVVSRPKLARLIELSDTPGVNLSCCVDNSSIADSTVAQASH